MRAAFALLGSGEFDPWTDELDRRLLESDSGRPRRVLILPTASSAEGDDVFDMWANKGLDHYARSGIEAEVVPLKTRDDATRADLIEALDRGSVAFFSGGNPAFLASVLRDTPWWAALLRAMDRGLAYAGCSAGVSSLGDLAPDSARQDWDDDLWHPGLSVFPGTMFGPHWDALDGFAPGRTEFIVGSVPDAHRLVAIDENTAIVGDGVDWTVMGVGRIHVLEQGAWKRIEAGDDLRLPLRADPRGGG
jgi:cyanophycinase-like exopeptidase